MGKRRKTKQPSILENDFERNADTRHGHISQKRRKTAAQSALCKAMPVCRAGRQPR